MELSELVVILIFKINRAFDLENDGNEERAIALFNAIVRMLSVIQMSCPEDIVCDLRQFSVFFKLPVKKSIFKNPQGARLHPCFPTFYATRNVRAYFESDWEKLCTEIADLDNRRCLKDGFKCFKRIYKFFTNSAELFYKKFDEGVHFQICGALEVHKKEARINFEVAIFSLYFKNTYVQEQQEKRSLPFSGFMKRDAGCPMFKK